MSMQSELTVFLVNWSQEDLQELVKRMEMLVPEKDNMAFCTRVEKLNWEKVGGINLKKTCVCCIFFVLFRLHSMIILRRSVRKHGPSFRNAFAGLGFYLKCLRMQENGLPSRGPIFIKLEKRYCTHHYYYYYQRVVKVVLFFYYFCNL